MLFVLNTIIQPISAYLLPAISSPRALDLSISRSQSFISPLLELPQQSLEQCSLLRDRHRTNPSHCPAVDGEVSSVQESLRFEAKASRLN
jgi:hypothetical protein